MSEEKEIPNEEQIENAAEIQPDNSAVSTDPRRLTNIDWSKDTPKTAEAWKALSSEEKMDWYIWHETKVQYTFATIAILLEIVLTNEGYEGRYYDTGVILFCGGRKTSLLSMRVLGPQLYYDRGKPSVYIVYNLMCCILQEQEQA